MTESNRRDFLKSSGALLAGAALAGVASAQTSQPAAGLAPHMGGHTDLMKQMIPGAVDADGNWALPPLGYEYDALEPHIDAKTMKLHHDKHHAGYVKGLIGAEKKLEDMRKAGDFDNIDHWSKKASFHGAGHFLHCVFWDSMGPNAGGDPKASLKKQIEKDFGSVEAFKNQFSAASKSVEGSGWGILAYQLASDRLTILQAQNHQLNSQWGLIPLLCIDVWEHAYYLNYQNDRGGYIKSWWNVVDWDKVQTRFGLLRGEMKT